MNHTDMNKELVLAHKAPAGAFVMVNLYRMKEGLEFADFLKEMAIVANDAFKGTSGKILYRGKVGAEFTTSESHWDYIIPIEYDTWEKVTRFFDDDAMINQLNDIRRKYLADSRWTFTTHMD